ncbi:hypothetical protein I4U23_010749 [Adineta vaga]|nr:hypothetical protein I4U23_010749 [Adineta vaga]
MTIVYDNDKSVHFATYAAIDHLRQHYLTNPDPQLQDCLSITKKLNGNTNFAIDICSWFVCQYVADCEHIQRRADGRKVAA